MRGWRWSASSHLVAQRILAARATPKAGNPGVRSTLAAINEDEGTGATCMHAGCDSDVAWASNWASPEPREPTTNVASALFPWPSSKFKRALLAA